ncbi:MAG: hypothetical protein IPP74_15240 [Alphaproteobacteria bacterium]|nr:hypothetical protein [Alphaproteobacteria bacterium]
MNILIDASIFQFSYESDITKYWEIIISRLPVIMPTDTFFILWRSTQSFTGTIEQNVNILAAPPADYDAIGCDHQRLSGLCNHLDIDVFLGSLYTSPPPPVSSLLFVYDMNSELFPTQQRGDDPIVLAKKYSIKTSSRFVVFNHKDADNLSAFHDVGMERIVVLSCPALTEGPETDVTAWDAHLHTLSTEIVHVSRAERTLQEQSTACEAHVALLAQSDHHHALNLTQLSIEMLKNGHHVNALHGFNHLDLMLQNVSSRSFDHAHALNAPSGPLIPDLHYVKAYAYFMDGRNSEAECSAL